MAERMLSSKSASLSFPITLPEDQFNSGMTDRLKTDVRWELNVFLQPDAVNNFRVGFCDRGNIWVTSGNSSVPSGTFRLPRVTQLLPPREAISSTDQRKSFVFGSR